MKLVALLLAAATLAAAPSLGPLDEQEFTRVLAANKDKVVLFDFWATWCEPCREELPKLVSLERKWHSRGLVLVTVSADEPESQAAALQFLLNSGVRFPAYVKHVRNDEQFIDSIDTKWSGALPGLFLYDRAGHRAASFIGEAEPADIEKSLDTLLAK